MLSSYKEDKMSSTYAEQMVLFYRSHLIRSDHLGWLTQNQILWDLNYTWKRPSPLASQFLPELKGKDYMWLCFIGGHLRVYMLCINWMFVFPKIHMLKHNPLHVKIFGGGAFGRLLSNEGRVLVNGISALIKGTLESSLAPSTIWGHSKKTVIYEPGSKPSLSSHPPEL